LDFGVLRRQCPGDGCRFIPPGTPDLEAAFLEHFAVQVLVALDHALHVETLDDPLAAGLAKPAGCFRVAPDAFDRSG
jgi:hypothetical protein